MTMVPESYLRVYQPLSSFDAPQRSQWEAYINQGAQLPITEWYRHVAFSDNHIGFVHPHHADHAYVKKVSDQWYVCPWRTKLRVLLGLLGMRSSLPYEIADAFVPEEAAEQAVGELERIRDSQQELRAYIQTATWHVPLRWFMGFDDTERVVTSERGRIKVRYETPLQMASERVSRGLEILKEAGMSPGVTEPVEEILGWMADFPSESVLELDYGTLNKLFSDEELALDRSAGEIWNCLEALEAGDHEESAHLYNDLAAWWGRVRSLQSAN